MVSNPVHHDTQAASTYRFHRRDWLLRAGAGMIVAFASHRTLAQNESKNRGSKRWPTPPTDRRPRFRKNKDAKTFVGTNLKSGFYINPRSKVVHYVNKDGRIRDVQRIHVDRLKPMSVADVTRLLVEKSGPRVHLTTASRALEEAALDHFHSNENNVAFQLLATAIRHDQVLKQKSHEMPSVRLYDLFAAMSVQVGDKAKQNELHELARRADRQVASPAPLKVGNIQTIPAQQPLSELRKWQAQRKLEAKDAISKARKSSLAARLKKWSAADSTDWKQKWQQESTTWKL
jgi:hypothetical protein